MANDALKSVRTRKAATATPQTEKAAKGQKQNHAGGFSFVISDMERARRFLIMGSEGSYYQAGAKLSLENAKSIEKIAKSEQARELVDLIVEISQGGRAAKQQPGLFALALVIASTEDAGVKNYAYGKLNDVARTGTTLFEFAGYLSQFQRFGMGAQKAFARWYTSKTVDQLAYQAAKYQSREGYSHADILRISKRVKSDEREELRPTLDWIVGRKVDPEALPKIIVGLEKAKVEGRSVSEVADFIRYYGLTWEMIPSEMLNEKKIWEALLDGNVPLGALLRQLPRLTRIGVIEQLGGRTQQIVDRLTDQAALVKARIHPLQILVAAKSYSNGEGRNGRDWIPVQRIVDALDKAFYLAFKAVEPTGKRWMLALDLSASMTWNENRVLGGILTAREASAALSLVTAATEPETFTVGFTSGSRYSRGGSQADGVTPLSISPSMRLDKVVREIESHGAGGTDCAAPMLYALKHKISADVFVVYTDNETWAGVIHPHEALVKYRQATGIDAKLIVVGMTATKFSIADPRDPGMLDIAGFDTAAPGLMAEFVRGV